MPRTIGIAMTSSTGESWGQLSTSVCISYRRDTASMEAALLNEKLTSTGLDVFYDHKSLDAGRFDQKILTQILARPYFVLILTPGTLDRCVHPTDWVRKEIEQAVAADRIIIPVH